LIFHPIRIRIVTLLGRESPVTAADLLARIPNVTQRSLYRHLRELLEGGLLEVESTRQVRGTIERSYRLAHEGAMSRKTFGSMTAEEWRRAFTLFMSTLQAEFASFIDAHPETSSRPWNVARMNEIRATPEQLRSAVYEALDSLSNLEQEQVDDEAERLSYRIAVVGFPLDGQ
jgi:DNA-binding transcriptional ArsR family regulator